MCVRFVVIVGREVTRPAPRCRNRTADEPDSYIIIIIYLCRAPIARDENEMQHRHEKNRLKYWYDQYSELRWRVQLFGAQKCGSIVLFL